MESNDFYGNLEEYNRAGSLYRAKTREEFYNYHGKTRQLIAALSETVAEATFFLSEMPINHIEHGQYIVKLIVSYCRSFFISLDLLADGDLIESALIVRRQLEVISRLNELSKGEDLKKLNNKTPNLKHLTGKLKAQYSNYSMVAHSSNIQGLDLLGKVVEGNNIYIPVHPNFQKNSYVNLQHIVICTAEFFLWLIPFYQKHFPLEDFSNHSKHLDIIWRLYSEIFSELEEKVQGNNKSAPLNSKK